MTLNILSLFTLQIEWKADFIISVEDSSASVENNKITKAVNSLQLNQEEYFSSIKTGNMLVDMEKRTMKCWKGCIEAG